MTNFWLLSNYYPQISANFSTWVPYHFFISPSKLKLFKTLPHLTSLQQILTHKYFSFFR